MKDNKVPVERKNITVKELKSKARLAGFSERQIEFMLEMLKILYR